MYLGLGPFTVWRSTRTVKKEFVKVFMCRPRDPWKEMGLYLLLVAMRDGKIDHEYCPAANQNVGITVFAHPAATAANCSGTVPRQQHHENSPVRRTATRIHHEQLREWKLFDLLCKSGPAPLGCGRHKEQEELCAPRSPWKTPLRFSTSRR